MHKFMIFGNARSGTGTLFYLFGDLGVNVVHEPFHPDKWPDGLDIEIEAQKVYNCYDAAKHLYSHLELNQNLVLTHWLLRHEFRIIYLKRRNKFLNAVSAALATATGMWGTETPEEREIYRHKVSADPLDPDLVRWIMNHTAKFEASLDVAMRGPSVFTIYYEDLYGKGKNGTLQTVEELTAFVGLHSINNLKEVVYTRLSKTPKQTTKDVYALIPNGAELEQDFEVKKGTLTGS